MSACDPPLIIENLSGMLSTYRYYSSIRLQFVADSGSLMEASASKMICLMWHDLANELGSNDKYIRESLVSQK